MARTTQVASKVDHLVGSLGAAGVDDDVRCTHVGHRRHGAARGRTCTQNANPLETVDTATKESAVSFKERTDVTAVPAMGVVAETMVALVLADEAQRKFGGDSLSEFVRNAEAASAALLEQDA